MRKWFSGTTGLVLAFLVGAVVASAATAGAASVITGRQIKDGSINAKDLSRSLRQQIAKSGLPGPKGDTGLQGPAGAAGKDGTNATLDGVAAGGALDGTYPNPTLKAGAVGVSSLNPNLQQSFQLQDNNRADSPSYPASPSVDGLKVGIMCSSTTENVFVTNDSGANGSFALSYVRGSGTALHDQGSLATNNTNDLVISAYVNTAGSANDRGSGQLLFWATDGRVWALDFNYEATNSYCSLQGVLRRA